MNISLSAFVPENLISRDGFGSPVQRQPAHLHTQAGSGAYLRNSSRVPGRRPFIYFKPPYAIGPVPSLSGHAFAYLNMISQKVLQHVMICNTRNTMLPWVWGDVNTRQHVFLMNIINSINENIWQQVLRVDIVLLMATRFVRYTIKISVSRVASEQHVLRSSDPMDDKISVHVAQLSFESVEYSNTCCPPNFPSAVRSNTCCFGSIHTQVLPKQYVLLRPSTWLASGVEVLRNQQAYHIAGRQIYY